MFKELFVVLSAKISGFIKGIKEALGFTQGARKQINAAAAEMGDAFESVFSGDLRNNISNLSESISVNRDRLVELKDELKKLQAELKKQKSGTEEFKNTERAIRRVQRGIFDTTQDLAKFNIAARDQKSALASSRLAAEDNSAAIEATSRAVNAATGALLLFGEGNETLKPVLKGVGIALGLVNVAIVFQNLRLRENAVFARAVTVAQGALRTAFVGTTAAATAFKTVLASLGIGLAIVAVATLIGKIIDVSEATSIAEESQKRFNESYSKFGGSELTKVNLLIAQVNDLSLSLDTRKAALKDLQGIFPAYFKNLSDEKILSGELRIETGKLTDAILKNAKARALREQIEANETEKLQIAKQSAQALEKLNKESKLFQEQAASGAESTGFYQSKIADLRKEISEASNRLGELNAENIKYSEQIDKINQQTDPIIGVAPDEPKKVKGIKEKATKEIKQAVNEQEKLAIIEARTNEQRLLFLAQTEEQRAAITNATEQEILNIRKQYFIQGLTAQGVSQNQALEAYAQYKLDVIEAEIKGNKLLTEARSKDLNERIKAFEENEAQTKESQDYILSLYDQYYENEKGKAAASYNAGIGSLEAYQENISKITLAGLKKRLQILKDFGLSTAEVELQIANMSVKTTEKAENDKLALLKRANQQLNAAYQSLFADLGQVMADTITALASGADPMQTLFSGILMTVANFMDTFGKAVLAVGVAMLKLEAGLSTLNPFLAIAGGVALIAAAGVARSIAAKGVTPFADGGIVSGPTLGLVGEYPGASTNPEVIAPLDKLKNMLGGQSEGTGYIAETRISGRDLSIVLNRYNKDNQRG
jgi:hypothetical protein